MAITLERTERRVCVPLGPKLALHAQLEGVTVRALAQRSGLAYDRAAAILRGDVVPTPGEGDALRSAMSKLLLDQPRGSES